MVISTGLYTPRHASPILWGNNGQAPIIPAAVHQTLTKALTDWPTLNRAEINARWEELVQTVGYCHVTSSPTNRHSVAFSSGYPLNYFKLFASLNGRVGNEDGGEPRYINEMRTVGPNLDIVTNACHGNEQDANLVPASLDEVTHFTMSVQAAGGSACFRIGTAQRFAALQLHELTAKFLIWRDVPEVVANLTNFGNLPYDEHNLFIPQHVKDALGPLISLQ